jgi:hypothetical protein
MLLFVGPVAWHVIAACISKCIANAMLDKGMNSHGLSGAALLLGTDVMIIGWSQMLK